MFRLVERDLAQQHVANSARNREHGFRQLGPAHHDVRKLRVRLVVGQGGPVDAGGVQPGGARHRHRSRGVPFELPAGVHAKLLVAIENVAVSTANGLPYLPTSSSR